MGYAEDAMYEMHGIRPDGPSGGRVSRRDPDENYYEWYRLWAYRGDIGPAHETVEGRLMLAALGLNGEAGEVADLVKKAIYHPHYDVKGWNEKLKLELGDVLWYVAYLCYARGWKFREIMEANVAKLMERYPDIYPEAPHG